MIQNHICFAHTSMPVITVTIVPVCADAGAPHIYTGIIYINGDIQTPRTAQCTVYIEPATVADDEK